MTSLSSLKILATNANRKFGGDHDPFEVRDMQEYLSPAFVLKMVEVCEAAVYAASDPEALDAALQRLKEE